MLSGRCWFSSSVIYKTVVSGGVVSKCMTLIGVSNVLTHIRGTWYKKHLSAWVCMHHSNQGRLYNNAWKYKYDLITCYYQWGQSVLEIQFRHASDLPTVWTHPRSFLMWKYISGWIHSIDNTGYKKEVKLHNCFWLNTFTQHSFCLNESLTYEKITFRETDITYLSFKKLAKITKMQTYLTWLDV